MRRWDLAATLVATSLAVLPASASVTRQIGFEQAVAVADAIVIGIVTANPDGATLENGKPFRHQLVRVSRYLKGGGPGEIVVLSPGGRYDAWVPGLGVRPIEAIDGNDCRLPAVGTEVLLFLGKRGDAFLVATVTHGIVPVSADSSTGRKTVLILLDRFENLSPSGRAALSNLRLREKLAGSLVGAAGRPVVARGSDEKFVDSVGVDELAQAIRNLKPSAPPRVEPK